MHVFILFRLLVSSQYLCAGWQKYVSIHTAWLVLPGEAYLYVWRDAESLRWSIYSDLEDIFKKKSKSHIWVNAVWSVDPSSLTCLTWCQASSHCLIFFLASSRSRRSRARSVLLELTMLELNTGDGLGERLPLIKSHMPPVPPFNPIT